MLRWCERYVRVWLVQGGIDNGRVMHAPSVCPSVCASPCLSVVALYCDVTRWFSRNDASTSSNGKYICRHPWRHCMYAVCGTAQSRQLLLSHVSTPLDWSLWRLVAGLLSIFFARSHDIRTMDVDHASDDEIVGDVVTMGDLCVPAESKAVEATGTVWIRVCIKSIQCVWVKDYDNVSDALMDEPLETEVDQTNGYNPVEWSLICLGLSQSVWFVAACTISLLFRIIKERSTQRLQD